MSIVAAERTLYALGLSTQNPLHNQLTPIPPHKPVDITNSQSYFYDQIYYYVFMNLLTNLADAVAMMQ